ncbi:hypothetical protein DVH24_021393 [Malus domestica]|uniref:RNase H type-1 domain-containing protein n=1 Tax=Malus domestica TaxID=3750 RepID=A0A498K2R5_MALDO|nr:hypothetical protein DVH24_021393 [Malus domestica]
MLLVLWSSPSFPWINTDGLFKGNPGSAACGGVFQDCNGHFLGEFAYQWGWHWLWLESYSSSVISALQSTHFDHPRPLRMHWSTCLDHIRKMAFYASHIYREGNVVADNFANIGLSSPTLVWLDSPLMTVHAALFSFYIDFSGFRFSN